MASVFPTWSRHPVKSQLSHTVPVTEYLGCTSVRLLASQNAPGYPTLLFWTIVGSVNRMTVGPRPLLHTERGCTEPAVAESWRVSLECVSPGFPQDQGWAGMQIKGVHDLAFQARPNL